MREYILYRLSAMYPALSLGLSRSLSVSQRLLSISSFPSRPFFVFLAKKTPTRFSGSRSLTDAPFARSSSRACYTTSSPPRTTSRTHTSAAAAGARDLHRRRRPQPGSLYAGSRARLQGEAAVGVQGGRSSDLWCTGEDWWQSLPARKPGWCYAIQSQRQDTTYLNRECRSSHSNKEENPANRRQGFLPRLEEIPEVYQGAELFKVCGKVNRLPRPA